MTYTITAFAAKDINVGLFSSRFVPAHVATVELETGDTISVSRLADEDYWIMDSHFRANGMPVFCNGEGSRVTAPKPLFTGHPLVVDLDARARS